MSGVFSALEVVPLTLITLDAWDFVQASRAGDETIVRRHRWTFYFLMAVGFWNFLGAGVFGFLINTPIVSYYEDRHDPHAQSWPCRDDGRIRHAGGRIDGVRAARDGVR